MAPRWLVPSTPLAGPVKGRLRLVSAADPSPSFVRGGAGRFGGIISDVGLADASRSVGSPAAAARRLVSGDSTGADRRHVGGFGPGSVGYQVHREQDASST
jgi:hypothetical protein